MNIFKYKWQAYLFASMFFSMVLLINQIAIEVIDMRIIITSWASGFIVMGIIFWIRRKEFNNDN